MEMRMHPTSDRKCCDASVRKLSCPLTSDSNLLQKVSISWKRKRILHRDIQTAIACKTLQHLAATATSKCNSVNRNGMMYASSHDSLMTKREKSANAISNLRASRPANYSGTFSQRSCRLIRDEHKLHCLHCIHSTSNASMCHMFVISDAEPKNQAAEVARAFPPSTAHKIPIDRRHCVFAASAKAFFSVFSFHISSVGCRYYRCHIFRKGRWRRKA